MAGYSPASNSSDYSNAQQAQKASAQDWASQAQQQLDNSFSGDNARTCAGASLLSKQMQQGIQTSGYMQSVSRIPVTREDLIEVALKLQEAASLITQAISRLGAR